MAKNQKKMSTMELADESSGGLSGFLADEGTFDRRTLWRLGSWGLGTIASITLAILANQTGSGLRKEARVAFRQDHAAAADLARQSQQLQSIAKASEREISRISSAIDTLNGDRDRLFARVTMLEQGLDSVTGSIRQSATRDKTQQVSSREAAPDSLPVEPPLLPPPDFALRTTRLDPPRTSVASDSQSADGGSSGNVHPSAPASIGIAAETAAKPSSAKPSPAPKAVQAAPRPAAVAGDEFAAAKSGSDETSSVTPATTKPNEDREPHTRNDAGSKDSQIVVASIPPVIQGPEASTSPIHVPVPHTDFGVDLGSANSIKGLRALWRSVLKSESKELASLHPIIVVKEHSNGIGMQLRLVAGPLSDAAAAARICAVLTENRRACETTVFEGQRLATNERTEEGETAVAAAKKPKWTSSRHRHSGRPVRAEEPVAQPSPAPPAPAPAPQPAFGSFPH